MLRQFHSVAGLLGALFVMLLGISGACLSIDPALERFAASVPAGVSVADMTARVLRHYPTAQQIDRSAAGTLIVYYRAATGPGADRVDADTGATIAPYVRSPFSRWVRQLHRSMLLGTPGRAAAGISAVALLLLCITGSLLLIKRVGGWRQLLRPLHGSRSQRWHAQVGRLAVLGLLLSALTGTYMSAVNFGVIADGAQAEPDFPATTAAGLPAPVASLAALAAVDLADLRQLVFPLPGERSAVYTLRTTHADAYVDQVSGAALSYRAHSRLGQADELVKQLHTGKSWWWLGLLLGVCALGGAWLAGTGAVVRWQRRAARPRIEHNSSASAATVVILVGSENNSTWGFARALHDGLQQAGQSVHTAAMNDMAARYRTARQLFVLTATYGDGDAPASASHFLARLKKTAAPASTTFAVLGFGDRQFTRFCQFARVVDSAMAAQGWQRALELSTIDRQSTQAFLRWGEGVAKLLVLDLQLHHTPLHPPTFALLLAERVDYGVQQKEPTVVLRFRSAATPGALARLFGSSGLAAFEAGDLLGVMAPGSPVPRLYSLASGADSGMVEICVRKQPGGLCSTYLHQLKPGDVIDAFIRPNPQFRPQSGRAPVILIGAGTGIGPLAGFIRNNTGKHPMYLYWGGRDPASDFLYEPELKTYLADRRLTALHTAFSRVAEGRHVQSRLLDDGAQLRALIGDGGQVLVCGSGAMAGSVREALDALLAPAGQSVQALRAAGRYREDVF
ncbi:PepSY domain-containing protein [Massilia sp. PWRC2]|uniref:PepSY domain-containing protein n=1 Tax=Massilia sp. PWRC2 TaxID=2804626 RepID=UPI003CF1A912